MSELYHNIKDGEDGRLAHIRHLPLSDWDFITIRWKTAN